MGPVPVICIKCKYRFSCPLRLKEMLELKEDWDQLEKEAGYSNFVYFKNRNINPWIMSCLDQRTEPFLTHTEIKDGKEYVDYRIRLRQKFIKLYREIYKI